MTKSTITLPVSIGDKVYFFFSHRAEVHEGTVTSILYSKNKKGEEKISFRVSYLYPVPDRYVFTDKIQTTNFTPDELWTKFFETQSDCENAISAFLLQLERN